MKYDFYGKLEKMYPADFSLKLHKDAKMAPHCTTHTYIYVYRL